jgi:hypothetical protein
MQRFFGSHPRRPKPSSEKPSSRRPGSSSKRPNAQTAPVAFRTTAVASGPPPTTDSEVPYEQDGGESENEDSVDGQGTQVPDPGTSADHFGLHTLWPPTTRNGCDASHTNVDIVAVHGLGGSLYHTWTEKDSGRLWLRDFLPNDIKDAHIMTFGYNSGLAFTGSTSRIEDFALELLNNLKLRRRRDKTQENPLIFICHSLGGIVVKKVSKT